MNVGDTLFAVTPSSDQLLTLTVEYSDHMHTRFTGGYWSHTPWNGKPPGAVIPPGAVTLDESLQAFPAEEVAREYMRKREYQRLKCEAIKAAAGCTKKSVTVEDLREVINILTRRNGSK